MLYFWKIWYVFILIKNILIYKEIIVNGNILGWLYFIVGGKVMYLFIKLIDMIEFIDRYV